MIFSFNQLCSSPKITEKFYLSKWYILPFLCSKKLEWFLSNCCQKLQIKSTKLRRVLAQVFSPFFPLMKPLFPSFDQRQSGSYWKRSFQKPRHQKLVILITATRRPRYLEQMELKIIELKLSFRQSQNSLTLVIEMGLLALSMLLNWQCHC